ncbi:MAG: divalent-cation tolerance protein CutA [Bauldia sp.]
MTEAEAHGKAEPLFVYATFPDFTTAETICEALVEEGLCACANLIPGMRSIYRWKGAVERADEVVAILKTVSDRAADVVAAIEARHSYETPAIVLLPIKAGSAAYLDWIRAETAG